MVIVKDGVFLVKYAVSDTRSDTCTISTTFYGEKEAEIFLCDLALARVKKGGACASAPKMGRESLILSSAENAQKYGCPRLPPETRSNFRSPTLAIDLKVVSHRIGRNNDGFFNGKAYG